jgi:hypothetical protein
MKTVRLIVCLVIFGFVILSCSKTDPTPVPAIISFTPEAGPVASQVTITGNNFHGTALNNEVRFNGTKATVVSSTNTSINVTVPTGATSGVITVTVGGQSGISTIPFTINPLIGSWKFTGATATNCTNPGDDGITSCTVDCPTLVIGVNTIVYETSLGNFNFNYTIGGNTLVITSGSGSFMPSYILSGDFLTLVYPPEDCSTSETYTRL